MRPGIWLAIALLTAAAPASAQESKTAIRDALLGAIRLPEATQQARVLGVPESDLRSILGSAREQRIPMGVLHEVLVTENESIREHGPIDNFGAFVNAKLKQGLRGRELAAAIRAEHAARGIGRGNRLKTPDGMAAPGERSKGGAKAQGGRPDGGGRPDAAPGKADPAGKPKSPGQSGQGGKPDAQGNSGKKGGR